MCPQVWLRFEKLKKDGTVMKLRIQDLPPGRREEAADLMVRYFARDEPFRKAAGFSKNPEALEEYKEYVTKTLQDPATRTVMCCADTDDDDETPDIMGISSIAVETKWDWDTIDSHRTEESTKLNEMCKEVLANSGFNLLKKLNLTSYYADKSLLVLPEYRGYGISQQFLTVRRIMCSVDGIPITGAWMSARGTQISAERDGWETHFEHKFKDLSQKYGYTFEDVPPTEKFMAAGPHPDYCATKSLSHQT
ncbi:uncharacterized protein LOC134648196 [Cydia amplana]|uniref:uncharacterized protein LOC134648196 n=1 Tax=Cydia amplana TaxID=1869771 RepID=UPI002FE5F5A9